MQEKLAAMVLVFASFYASLVFSQFRTASPPHSIVITLSSGGKPIQCVVDSNSSQAQTAKKFQQQQGVKFAQIYNNLTATIQAPDSSTMECTITNLADACTAKCNMLKNPKATFSSAACQAQGIVPLSPISLSKVAQAPLSANVCACYILPPIMQPIIQIAVGSIISLVWFHP